MLLFLCSFSFPRLLLCYFLGVDCGKESGDLLTFHSKVVSGIHNGLQYQATSVSINLEKNRKSSERAFALWFHLTMVLNHISPCLAYGNV